MTAYEDGGWFEYDPATGRWIIRGVKSVLIESSQVVSCKTGEFVIEADTTRINSNVILNGDVTHGGGAMTSNGVVADKHKHPRRQWRNDRRPILTLYIGMSRDTGRAITESDHLRQSVRDILLTPQGSRLARREYGSLLSALIDQPQNPALRLQIMAAVYVALRRWEPRLQLDTITVNSSNMDGAMVIELAGQRNDGVPVSLSVSTGADNGRY